MIMGYKKSVEIYRKAIHIVSIIIPILYRFALGNDRKLAITVLVPLTLLTLLIEVMRMENKTVKRVFYGIFGIMLRKKEIKSFTGASYLLFSSIICIALFPPDITFVALAFLAIGDTFAAIVGLYFGRRKLVGSKKSLEGSIACFVGSFAFALFFLSPLIALFGAIAATYAESSKIQLDDNIKIPILSAVVMGIVYLFI